MQTGFYFDQTRCTGCKACAVACKDWHDIPAGPASWMRVNYREEGEFPKLFVSHIASPCYHCTEPVCAYICPNEAITKRDADGIVVVDREKCRGEVACGITDEKAMGTIAGYGQGIAPCQLACPAHLQVPAYINMAAKGRFKEALDIVRWNMPLPSVCGRVCLHPCETVCKRAELEEPISIMMVKGYLTDNVIEEKPQPLPQYQGKSVAIVGSGPAGLAAAYDLIRMGYSVTVFEAMAEPGGMLIAGVPAHRLPRQPLKRDIDYLKALGITIKTNNPIDLAHPDRLLADGFKAVLLALGAHKGRKLSITGADLKGSESGTDFMRAVNLGRKPKVDQTVWVIGGGNVAIDCARSAVRLGAKDVHVACLEGAEEMPADAAEIAQAEEEGIKIHPCMTLTKINGKRGKVSGLVFSAVTDFKLSPTGEVGFRIVPGTEQTVPANTVIFAVGQSPDLGKAKDLEVDRLGNLQTDTETTWTGHTGIFAAGDCCTGATSIVEAIAHGQKAAFFIDRYLKGDVLNIRPATAQDPKEIKVSIPPTKTREARKSVPLIPVAKRLNNFNEVVLGYDREVVIAEAKRCLNCAGHLCRDACPYSAPQFAAEEKAKMQKCDLCQERWPSGQKPICVEACPTRALDAGRMETLEGKFGGNRGAFGFSYSAIAQPSIVHKEKKPPHNS